MTQNPIKNALAATLYICAVALFMSNGEKIFGPVDTILIPIAMLSLFCISAAIMGYIVCFEPLKLFLEGKKNEAVSLFLKTIGVMAIVTVFVLITAFLTR